MLALAVLKMSVRRLPDIVCRQWESDLEQHLGFESLFVHKNSAKQMDPLSPGYCALCHVIVTVVFTDLFSCFYREPFKSDCSAQTDGDASSLWDDSSTTAGGSRVETSHVTGKDQHLNTSGEPNDSLSHLLCSVGMTCVLLL